jgi:hypothetical protein
VPDPVKHGIPVSAASEDPLRQKGFPMTQTNIIGLGVLVLGAVLLFFAWRASQAPMDQMSEALTGRFTNNTMWYLLSGIVGVVAGAGLLWRGYAKG